MTTASFLSVFHSHCLRFHDVVMKIAVVVVLGLVVALASGQSQEQIKPPFGGKLLNEALLHILGPLSSNITSRGTKRRKKWLNARNEMPSSRIRIRCNDYLACEYPIPAVELDNVIVYQGTLYLTDIDPDSRHALQTMNTYFAVRQGYLTSTLVQYKSTTEWLHGPPTIIYNVSDMSTYPRNKDGSRQPLAKCARIWDTSAYFLHPWQSVNAYHAFNDNIIAILATIVVQYLTSSDATFSTGSGFRTLFMFRKLGYTNRKVVSQVFKILFWIFEGDVREAKQLFDGGPHCLRHMSWGTTIKPFYRDSLVVLRRVIYSIMQHTLRSSPSFPLKPSHELQPHHEHEGALTTIPSPITTTGWFSKFWSWSVSPPETTTNHDRRMDIKNALRTAGIIPRVIIVTRNLTGDEDLPGRKIAWRSEIQLQQTFEDRGAKAVICCDFVEVNTVPKLMKYFSFVDICIGIHGAGLSNCALASDHLILIELQGQWAFGFDSFMKLAHMSNGLYIHYDIRNLPLNYGLGAGALLDTNTIEQLVDISLLLYLQYKVITKPSNYHHATSLSNIDSTLLSKKRNGMDEHQQKIRGKKDGKGIENKDEELEDKYLHRTKSTSITREQKIWTKKQRQVVEEEQYNVYARRRRRLQQRNDDESLTSHRLLQSLPMDLMAVIGDASNISIASLTPHHSTHSNASPVDGPWSLYLGNNVILPPKKFWLFVHPLRDIDHQVRFIVSFCEFLDVILIQTCHFFCSFQAILGPLLRTNTEHCMTLPYYKFRLMTLSPAEHKYQCDLNIIIRQPSEVLNDLFLSEFVMKKPRPWRKANKGKKGGTTKLRIK